MRIVATKRQGGFALVLTLALVVLMTFAVVAYFSRAITNRRIESATFAAASADTLARAASQIIASDVRSEIVAGSNINQPIGQMAIYSPSDPQKMVLFRTLRSGLLSNSSLTNLSKQSGDRFFPALGYSGTPLIITSTGRNTSIVSANNRTVSAARWNAPVLNTSGGFTADTDLPSWILFDRSGLAPSQTWDVSFRDYTPGNDNAIVGRFAFNIYDTGGVLDSSIAGLPVFTTPLTDSQVQQVKSTEAGASLYDRVSPFSPIIPGFDAAKQTAFVNTWRFKSSSTNSANTLADLLTSTTLSTFSDSGFMRPTIRSSNSNSMAFSRQDLLRATTASNAYLSTVSLPYLSHFNRELNAPSWSPVTPAGSSIDSAGQSGQGSATNRDVLTVRVVNSFTRSDGTAAIPGEPLMKNRFPLRRLDGIGYNGINTTSPFPVMFAGALQAPTAATVQRDFGLIWNSNRWEYVGASGSTVQNTIATLAEVASANREPNFFEILKAFILSGSVGLGTDNTSAGRTFVTPEAKYYDQTKSKDAQIIQIGANIIDQWDADKNPTFIFFTGNEFAGIENLPYLNKIAFQCRWSTASNPVFSAFIVPSFWTPAQNATAVGTQNTTTIPAVRFVMTSGTASAVVESSTASATSAVVTGTAASPSVNLTQSATFGPVPDAASSTTTTKSGMSGTANSKLGITFTFSSMNGVTKTTTVKAYPKLDKAVFEMQVQIGGSSAPWKTYQKWFEGTVNTSGTTVACEPAPGFDWSIFTIFDPEFVALDPRTMRFGAWQTDGKGSGDSTDFTRGVDETLDRASVGFQVVTGLGPQGTSFTGVGAQMANNTGSSPGYLDLDGIRRRGDYLTATTTTSALLPTNSADRSPILNSVGRQLRTVTELGTVFRDQPWKTLNFTTADSGDSGLLDAFAIFEPNSVFRSDITAGKISLNTRQPLVLQAVLAGVAKNTNNSTPLISALERSAVANALVAMTATQPMLNKSELVTRLAADPTVSGLGNKEAREAVIRALSDVGQTRTWNLMIDVIAQSGKYGASATAVDNFIAEGEKRYWLHVAIDRFTGEVIDQQLEKINE